VLNLPKLNPLAVELDLRILSPQQLQCSVDSVLTQVPSLVKAHYIICFSKSGPPGWRLDERGCGAPVLVDVLTPDNRSFHENFTSRPDGGKLVMIRR
jgi:hypothetical protein